MYQQSNTLAGNQLGMGALANQTQPFEWHSKTQNRCKLVAQDTAMYATTPGKEVY